MERKEKTFSCGVVFQNFSSPRQANRIPLSQYTSICRKAQFLPKGFNNRFKIAIVVISGDPFRSLKKIKRLPPKTKGDSFVGKRGDSLESASLLWEPFRKFRAWKFPPHPSRQCSGCATQPFLTIQKKYYTFRRQGCFNMIKKTPA